MPTGNIWGITAETSDIAVSGDNPWARTYVIEPRNKDSTTIQRAVRRRQSRQKQQQQQLEEWFLTGDWDDAPGIDNDVHKKATRLLKSELRSSKTAPTDDHDTATSTAQEINDELIKDCIKKAMTKPDSSEPTEEEINASLADYRTKYMSNIQTAYGGAREKLKDEDIRQLTDLDQEFQRMYESEKTKNKDAKSFDIQINDNITFTTGDKNKVSVGGKGTPKEKMEQLMGQLELAKNRNTEPKMNTPINIKLCGSKAVQREKLFHIMKICKERGIDLNNYTLGEDGKRLEAVTIKDMKAGYFASLRRPWKTIPNTVKRCRKTFDLANPNSVAYRKMELDDTSLEDKNGKPFTYESAKKEIKELKKIQGEGGLSDQGEQKLESLKEAIKAHKEKYKTKQTVTVVKSSKGPMGSIATAKEVSKAIAEYKKAKEKLKEDGTRKGLVQFGQKTMGDRKSAFEKAKKQLEQLGIDPDNMDKNNKKIREARKVSRTPIIKKGLPALLSVKNQNKRKITRMIKNITSKESSDDFKTTQKEALTALLAESSYFQHAETQGKKQGLENIKTIITNAKARKKAKKEAKGFKSSSMSKYSKREGITLFQKRQTLTSQTSVKKDMTELLKAAKITDNTSDAHAIKEKLETELQKKEESLETLNNTGLIMRLGIEKDYAKVKNLAKALVASKQLKTLESELETYESELETKQPKLSDPIALTIRRDKIEKLGDKKKKLEEKKANLEKVMKDNYPKGQLEQLLTDIENKKKESPGAVKSAEAELKKAVAAKEEKIKNLKKQIKKAEKLVTDSNKLLLQTMELNQGDNKIFDKCLERAKAAKNTKNLKKYLQKEYERRMKRLPNGNLTFDKAKISNRKVTIDGVEIDLDKDGNLDLTKDKDGNLDLTKIDTISDEFGDKNKSSIEAGNQIKAGNPEDALRSLKEITTGHHDYHAVTEMKNEMADAALTITQNEPGTQQAKGSEIDELVRTSPAAQALIMVAGDDKGREMIENKIQQMSSTNALDTVPESEFQPLTLTTHKPIPSPPNEKGYVGGDNREKLDRLSLDLESAMGRESMRKSSLGRESIRKSVLPTEQEQGLTTNPRNTSST